ncbi:MAG: hypothetical protein A3C61_03450 [Candidatus Yanofskybacteria bacterium RIFCSPHIGHO2_02_FULL_39_10]|uniref:Uncharacterized protein n=1 Tax=Candidatus Yanofskybacteria bacterium RIFCSPHIGHO2_02_FULL_39_10 TaxID=1802674 RepID=A0A1F8F9K5_9BACT|nr:MAG: hypothetical protein A3C61_03450 [Candidatus Yanofskybacteria bacterium RIFCSPHIGHO2_02_FULL_39_10]
MKKEQIKIKSLILLLVFFVILLSTFYFLFSVSALAHDPNDTTSTGFWTPGDPIVPCGNVPAGYYESTFTGPLTPEQTPCDRCQLFHLLRHLIDLVLVFIAPVVGTLFFIVAGVMIMMGGDNPGLLSRGKSIFNNTLIGIFIILMAWLVTNTLIQTLAKSGLVGEGGSWWTFNCTPTTVP